MKNLLITGGSQGIGKATALEAAKKGMFIGINYNSNDKAAEETLSEVKELGGEGVILKCDVSKNSAVKDMFENFVNNAGSLDGVFNNAGTTGPVSKIHELDPKDFKSLIDTNVIGAFNVAQESSKIMIKQKMGNIVNMTSIAADIGGAGELVHYAMSKGAIDSLTYGMAKELGVYGIRVNAVAPGLIATDIHEKAGDASRVERLMPSVPLGRVGLAKEVADTVMWLLSEKSSYVCGTIIRISGGR
ncbi:MAG: glucose-1-dehydrogenase [Alphaproteobacteria bacterium]|jgi:glucose 1-dehydrogenase|nr:MAG: glucose-1-dehydrogenase [Alphaproteobacteria bacterium]|tara:strand:- start:765 stop:1499 length:735 start_codon:yes stop_codon:yes gene_type:complete